MCVLSFTDLLFLICYAALLPLILLRYVSEINTEWSLVAAAENILFYKK